MENKINLCEIKEVVKDLNRFIDCRYGICTNCEKNIVKSIEKLNRLTSALDTNGK